MDARSPGGVAVPELLLAIGVIALGLFFGLGALAINVSPGYARVGPRAFPIAIAAGLIAAGAWLAADALRGKRAQPAEEEDADADQPTDTRALATLVVALVVNILLMDLAGFVVASTALFWLGARAFGSRRWLRDALVGLALSVAAYLIFNRLLGLTLPAGVLRGIL